MDEDQVKKALLDIIKSVTQLQTRLTRMETRLVKFMAAASIDTQGNPLDHAQKSK